MIPVFPLSKKLALSHKKDLQKALATYASHSDFNFAGLWTYDVGSAVELSTLHGNLVIKTGDYATHEPFYSFLGETDVASTIRTLLVHAKKEGIISSVKLIHERIVSTHDLSKHFEVTEDRDNFDYILSISELVAFAGAKYHKQRKLVNKFNKQYQSIRPTLLSLTNKKTQADILNLFSKWEKERGESETETETELVALKRVFIDPDFLHFMATGLYNEDKLIAFFIFDVGHEIYSYSHFFKSLHQYVGVLQVLRQFSARILHTRGLTYLNIEQDLGIPGLRTAKEQWNPVAYIKKYSISEKH